MTRVAILAYGSLITVPGAELGAMVERVSGPLPSPFEVEYARTTHRRSGAPVLTIVPAGGAAVAARLLILRAGLPLRTVLDVLYRREEGRVGERSLAYDERRERSAADGVLIEQTSLPTLPDTVVLYCALRANFTAITDPQQSQQAKASLLAKRAIESVAPHTFEAGRDGIRYLADALSAGIQTPLSAAYRDAVLERTGAATLEQARQRVARQRGILEND